MELVLLRHGIEEEGREPPARPRAERVLSAKGIRRTTLACRGLAALDIAPDVILTSPLPRARQTAAIAAEVLRCPRVEATDALRGGTHTQEAFRCLAERRERAVLCVGHAPHLDLLLTQAIRLGEAAVPRMKKAGAALIEFEEVGAGLGRLAWQMQPKALRTLGRSVAEDAS